MESLKLSRQVVNEIFHHAQLEENACGYLTESRDGYQRIESVSLESIIENSVTTPPYAVYKSYRNSTGQLNEQEWSLFARENSLILLVLLTTKGVLEIKAYRFQGKGWQELNLDLYP